MRHLGRGPNGWRPRPSADEARWPLLHLVRTSTETKSVKPLPERHMPVRASQPAGCPKAHSGVDSSHGVHRVAPASTQTLRVHSRLTEASLWHEVATPRARSALAVPPGFGGLLRTMLCRFVAPCSRPWGSHSFGRCCLRGIVFPCTRDPSKLSPPWQPPHVTRVAPVHRASCPRAVASDPRRRSALPRSGVSGSEPQPRGFAPPESPLPTYDVATAGRSMLPWASGLTSA
jgi:hypothetical protein